MVLRTASHMVSSHQTRDLVCFKNNRNIPWSQPTFFHPSRIANSTADVPFLNSTHCSLSNPIRFLICVVLTYNDSRIILPQAFANFSRIVQCKWLLVFLVGSRNFCRLFWVSWEVFCFALVGIVTHWVAKSCTTNSVSMIVSWFTSFTENFVIRDNYITKIFPLWARLYQYVLPQEALVIFVPEADVTISVFREVTVDTVLTPDPLPLLLATPLVNSREELERVLMWLSILIHQILFENPVAIPAHLAEVHFVILLRRLHFYLCFRFSADPRDAFSRWLLTRNLTSFCCWIFRANHRIL